MRTKIKIVKVETTFPMPPPIARNSVRPVLRRMRVGESVVVPSRVKLASWYEGATALSCRIASRKIGTDSYRVWKTSASRDYVIYQ